MEIPQQTDPLFEGVNLEGIFQFRSRINLYRLYHTRYKRYNRYNGGQRAALFTAILPGKEDGPGALLCNQIQERMIGMERNGRAGAGIHLPKTGM